MQFVPMKLYRSLLLCCSVLLTSQVQSAEEIDSIAVVVNDSIISQRDIDIRLKDFKQQIKLQGQRMPPENLLRKQVVERMIIDEIQLQIAKQQGIFIDDISLNKMLESIAEKNRTSLTSLRKKLEDGGISYNEFREQTRKDMMIRQLQQRLVQGRVKVSEQEINIFLDQQQQSGKASGERYHLSHILVSTPEAASPEQVNASLEKARQALNDIKNGKPFADVALKFSDGPHAIKGGDLGWRTAAELPSLFLETARNLKKDEISEPLRSAGGFHIIKLVDKQTQQHMVKQTHARHILIKADEINSDEQVRAKMQSIRKRLDKGEDFAALAAEFSQDPGSKNNGGDLGWAPEGTFVPRFTEVMNSLRVNQVSEPFKSQFGWHIVQVLGRRQQDETDQIIRMNAERAIQNRKAEEELQLWLRQARDEAYVDYRIDLDK